MQSNKNNIQAFAHSIHDNHDWYIITDYVIHHNCTVFWYLVDRYPQQIQVVLSHQEVP